MDSVNCYSVVTLTRIVSRLYSCLFVTIVMIDVCGSEQKTRVLNT